jgi:hypothetical protein
VKQVFFISLFLLACAVACVKRGSPKKLFEEVAVQAGIDFRNDLQLTEEVNPYTFRNFFNGGGVALGDINNDGLIDIYFAGNQTPNKLFLNQGNFTFSDITETAGVACAGAWSTGVSFVDVNADGWLDIYVCKSGPPDTPGRHNELFINNQNLTFTEQAAQYGLDMMGLSVQAAFFDFDRDGDLDCYILSNSTRSVGVYDLAPGARDIPDASNQGNKFLVNENGRFYDRTAALGIYHSAIGFGLGITLGDFNGDSWTDIFISNDFFERDYLYLNQSGKRFTEALPHFFQSISTGSMGADFADLNNNGDNELIVTEMLPASLARWKTKTIFDTWDRNQLNVQSGYHQQFSRNVLQTKVHPEFYSEVGRFSGVAASEWSWGALIFDMDNDGWKDVYVANGIGKDLLDRDYLAFSSDPQNVRNIIKTQDRAVLKLLDLMPHSEFTHYAWKNQKDLRFENYTDAWGLAHVALSNGSAYGDLDNDGDLDLVVNGVNNPARVYKNHTDTAQFRSVRFALREKSNNTFALGSVVKVYTAEGALTADNFNVRGFQSAVPPEVVIGLGAMSIDSVKIFWPDNTDTTLYHVLPNASLLVIKTAGARASGKKAQIQPLPFECIRRPEQLFTHQATDFNDFDREPLLTQMYCNETPHIAAASTPDGKFEFYVGGGAGQAGVLISWNGKFFESRPVPTPWNKAEEAASRLVDLDGDGDNDLVFATGGRRHPNISQLQSDRIFLNDGRGNFTEAPDALPLPGFATSAVWPLDYDNDGDPDLIFAERFDPFVYGTPGGLYFLENNGNAGFKNVTDRQAAGLAKQGMITAGVAVDLDRNGFLDLVLVGDWMPLTWIKNEGGRFVSKAFPLEQEIPTKGWWRTIHVCDLNNDGRPDFLLGNHGLNTFAKAEDRLWISDFDNNGSVEQIYTTRDGDRFFPFHERDELTARIPSLKKNILKYADYARYSLTDIFPDIDFRKTEYLEVNELASCMVISSENGYQLRPLPHEAQYAPIYAFETGDLDNDGVTDVIAGGNQYLVKPIMGRQDASPGWFFRGLKTGGGYALSPGQGLNIRGQVRALRLLDTPDGKKILMVGKYGEELELYEIRR